jgi:hypothetical protein
MSDRMKNFKKNTLSTIYSLTNIGFLLDAKLLKYF